jgi:hypothetical protein
MYKVNIIPDSLQTTECTKNLTIQDMLGCSLWLSALYFFCVLCGFCIFKQPLTAENTQRYSPRRTVEKLQVFYSISNLSYTQPTEICLVEACSYAAACILSQTATGFNLVLNY